MSARKRSPRKPATPQAPPEGDVPSTTAGTPTVVGEPALESPGPASPTAEPSAPSGPTPEPPPPPPTEPVATPPDPETPPGLAQPVAQSFDELHERAAKAQPRRGSMLQPPPAWEPDEVTLGFAMVSDDAGGVHELPEPTLLATILVAVEADRRRLLHRIVSRTEEEIEGVANLFWPLVVLPAREGPGVAIFDGTGVWKRAFRYTLLPDLAQVAGLLDASLAPPEYLERMRQFLPHLAHDPGAEVLTVEGFMPVDPPLLFDVLSHSDLRSDPQSPHAGFLPARHDLGWYRETVDQMYRWLDRFDSDLQKLAGVKERVEAIAGEVEHRLEEEYRRLDADAKARVAEAAAQADVEIAQLQHENRGHIQLHLARIRQAQAAIAHAETEVATADTLSFRASHRRTEGGEHSVRRSRAEARVRSANREGAESRKEIERIHAKERSELDRAVGKVTQVEQRYARMLADRELFRDELSAAKTDLLQAIDGQMAARSSQKNLLGGYFLPVASLAGVRVVWFPLWVASLKGPNGIRQIVFPPMRVLSGKRLGGALRQLFGGVVLPVEPRTAQFDQVLRTTMEEALRRDPWLSSAAQEFTRAADVLVDPDVLERLQLGLRTLRREGWITQRQEESFLASYVQRAQRKAGVATGARAPVPAGAKTDRPPSPPATPP